MVEYGYYEHFRGRKLKYFYCKAYLICKAEVAFSRPVSQVPFKLLGVTRVSGGVCFIPSVFCSCS